VSYQEIVSQLDESPELTRSDVSEIIGQYYKFKRHYQISDLLMADKQNLGQAWGLVTTLEFMDMLWSGYVKLCEDRAIALYYPEKGQIKWIPMVYKGSSHYSGRMRAKVEQLTGKIGECLTLRWSPRLVGSIWQVFKSIKKNFQKVLQSINRRLKKEGRSLPNYIWSVEPNLRGYPHIHMIFDTDFLLPFKDLLKIFQRYFDIESAGIHIETVKTRFVEGKDKLVGYLMKYITKTQTKIKKNIEGSSNLWNAITMMTRCRSWGHSDALSSAGGLAPDDYVIFLGTHDKPKDLKPMSIDDFLDYIMIHHPYRYDKMSELIYNNSPKRIPKPFDINAHVAKSINKPSPILVWC